MTIGKADYNTVSVNVGNLPRIHTLLEPESAIKITRNTNSTCNYYAHIIILKDLR